MVHVCGEGLQLSQRWLTEWHPARHHQRQRSMDLRLSPHVIGRGEDFFHLCSALYLTHQGQIEYIWSKKYSFGTSFTQVPTFGAMALTVRQFTCCSSWCAHLCFVTALLVLQAVKNRYWPVLLLMWQFVGGYSLASRCSLQPEPNPQTAYFSPTYSTQVSDP